MTSHALRLLVVVVKIAPSVARSRESVKKSAEAPCRPRQATRCFTKLCTRLLSNSKKFSLDFFFSMNEELRSVVKEHFNEKPFFPNSGYRVCSRKTCLSANTISLVRKRIEGEEGVSEIGDIEQLE